MSLAKKSDKKAIQAVKRPELKPGYQLCAIKNGNKIVRWHLVKDNTRGKTKFFREKMDRLSLDMLNGIRLGIQKDGKTTAEEEDIMYRLEFEFKPCSFGIYVGDMPDGACGLNAYRAQKGHPNDKIYFGYYLYQPTGEREWYALEHFWIMRKDKKGMWRVIEHTGTEGKPDGKAMYVGRECTRYEAFNYAVLHDHFSLWGEKIKEE
jgi:hypothetical protein